MTGTVLAVSRTTGMAVVQADGLFSVIEASGGHDFELGDEISGDLHSEGSCVVENVTQCESVEAVIQKIHGSKAAAVRDIN